MFLSVVVKVVLFHQSLDINSFNLYQSNRKPLSCWV